MGELNVDIILDKIDGFPEISKEKLCKDMTVTLGSSSAIFASNLSTLGTSVTFLGKIGRDNFGKLVVDTLHTKNVNTDFIIRSGDYSTGATIVLNYDMDRANVTFPGAMECMTMEDLTGEMLSQARHLHVSSIFLQPKLKDRIVKIFQLGKEYGLTTSLDPQWDPAENWDLDLPGLLPHVDVFLPNRKEFQYLARTVSMDEGLAKLEHYANAIIIKDGKRGAHLWTEGQLITAEAFLNENVADCIGAGDSFDAGFISQFIQGKPLEQCLTVANVCGAINTTKPGGTTAFESMEKIRAIARDSFSHPF